MASQSADTELTEIKTAPYVPLSHPFVERLIGTFVEDHSGMQSLIAAQFADRVVSLLLYQFASDRFKSSESMSVTIWSQMCGSFSIWWWGLFRTRENQP